MDCIFCKIITNEINSYTIYEDDDLKVFLDINPDSNGHMLIVPKKHFTNLIDIDNQTLTKIFDLARVMHDRLVDKLNIDGLTLVQNNGAIQDVKHFHLHLKPYYNEPQTIIDVKDIFAKLK